MDMEKDLVVGLGEIGTPILKVFSNSIQTAGYDKDQILMNKKEYTI